MANPTTVEISEVEYEVYADPDFVTAYMQAAIHGAAWLDATELVQKQACVSFTRLIERQVWQGTKTGGASQALWFPATGLKYADGSDVDPDTIPAQFLNGFCEGCLALVEGSTIQTATSTESNVSSLSAGSVSISFWRGAGVDPSRFPVIIDELLSLWLAASDTGIGLVSASGIDGCSGFSTRRPFGFTEGL